MLDLAKRLVCAHACMQAGAVSPLEECWMANGEAVGSTHVAEAFAAGYSVTVRGVHARDAQVLRGVYLCHVCVCLMLLTCIFR